MTEFEANIRKALDDLVQKQPEVLRNTTFLEHVSRGDLSAITQDMLDEFTAVYNRGKFYMAREVEWWGGFVLLPLEMVDETTEHCLQNSSLLVSEEIFQQVGLGCGNVEHHIRYVTITNSDVIREHIYEDSKQAMLMMDYNLTHTLYRERIRFAYKHIGAIDWDIDPDLFICFVENCTDVLETDVEDREYTLSSVLRERFRGPPPDDENFITNVAYLLSLGASADERRVFHGCLDINSVRLLRILLNYGLEIPKFSGSFGTLRYIVTSTTPEILRICEENGLYEIREGYVKDWPHNESEEQKLAKIQPLLDRGVNIEYVNRCLIECEKNEINYDYLFRKN